LSFSSRQANKPNDICSAINDPANQRLCRCTQCLPISIRSSPFIPFHRRPRTTPSIVSDSSIRNKIEPIKPENPSESIENADALIESTSSPIVTTNTQPTTNEKPNDWSAFTPNSVGISGPPSVLASITNVNSVSASSPATNLSSSRGIKRSATMAFDDTIVEDDEREQHKQTYDFYRTDSL
jgi:hypothetical protein